MNKIIKIISTLVLIAVVISLVLVAKNQPIREEVSKESVLGKGDLKVIVYEDLSDLYSAQYNKSLNLALENYSDQISLVFKPYANKMFKASYPVQSFLACAKEQGAFFPARDLIISKLEEESLDLGSFLQYGQDLSLDSANLDLCLKEGRYIGEIEESSKEALSLGIYGAPSTLIGSDIILGARSFEDSVSSNNEDLPGLKSIIEKYLK